MAQRKTGSTTLKQVAERAGVSMAAVSAVLNSKKSSIRISPATAELIQQAAKDLHYVPNGLARSLRTNRTNNIGLVFENFGGITEGQFYVELLDGVAQELFKNKYRLTILPEVDRVQPINSLGNGLLDGVIWCKLPQSPDVIDILQRCPIPFVALHARPTEAHEAAAYISADNYGGAKLAVQHLHDFGHKRLLFVLETAEVDVPDAQARLAGFLDACAELNIEVQDQDVRIWSHDLHETTAYFQSHPDHTAIITWNERTAGVLLEHAQSLNIQVPQNLSVISFDSTSFSEKTSPRLTCIYQPIREMATAAVRTLLAQINGETITQDFEYPTRLDLRDSTTEPPKNRDWSSILNAEKSS